MITFNSLGRFGKLGNQMFQYGALFGLAKKRGYEFGIPLKNSEWGISAWYDCKLFLPDLFNITAKDSSDVQHTQQLRYEKPYFTEAIFGLPDNIDLLGYFQSEKYFKENKQDLLKEFSFKNQELVDNTKKEFNGRNFIGLHVRRGDYLKLPQIHVACDYEYYKKSIDIIKNKNRDVCLYVFSDDINWCKQNLNFSMPMFFDDAPESEEKYYTNQEKTLIKMSLCNHFICANSSFSWWGSYLINNQDKIVCMPQNWFGPAVKENWNDVYYEGVVVV